MRKRCPICGNKLNVENGECTDNQCVFKDVSKEFEEYMIDWHIQTK